MERAGGSEERDREALLEERAGQASSLLAARASERREAAGAFESAEPVGERGFRQAYPKSLAEFIKQNAVYIAGVAAVVAVVTVLVVVAGTFMTGCSSEEPVAVEPAYESPYDWNDLDRADGRYRYFSGGKLKSRIGIDVSENQHDIDWYAVAADGIDFAMIRVGYRGATAGDLYLDEYYWANLDGARAAGLDCGAYFFSQAQTVDEAVEEADFVLEYLNGTPLEYPVVFDSEEVVLNLEQSRTTGLSSDEMTAIACAFCDRIESAGYESMIYGNDADMARYNYEEIADYPVWWAEYEVPFPHHDLDIVMWQYTNAGEVAGVPAAVDLNVDLSSALG